MSERNRRRRKLKIKGLVRLLLIVLLTVFFIYKLIEWNMTSTNVTYNLEHGEIPVEASYRALIIRKEIVLTSPISGRVSQLSDDGDKVKKSQRVMDVVVVEDMAAPSESAEVVVNDFSLSVDQVSAQIESLKAEIAEAIQSERYTDVHVLSEELKLKIDKRALMNNDDRNESSVVQTAMTNGDLNPGESQSILTTSSGILTYYIDGYEGDITYDNVFNLKFDEILSLDIEPYLAADPMVYSGDPLYKIVDDSSYYLIIVTEQGSQNKFDISSDLKITTENKTLLGSIEEIFAAGDQVAIAIKVEEFIEDFYKDRFVNIQLKQEPYKGLKIKLSSLLKKGDTYGVYVVDKLNRVLFKPVKIIKYEGENAIVKETSFYDIVNGESVIIDSVSIYDRVIIDSSQYQQGDTIK